MKSVIETHSLSKNFVIRTPLFSTKFLMDFFENKDDKNIATFFSNAITKEALLLASPDLYDRLKEISSNNKLGPENSHKIELSLFKYFNRMTSRSTPFGLFASVTPGKFAENSEITLNPPEMIIRKSRLDMEVSCAIFEVLKKDINIIKSCNFKVNSSLYRFGINYRYFEYRYKEKKRNYHLINLDSNSLIDDILIFINDYKSYQTIFEFLTKKGLNEDQSANYLETLIKHQIIVSDLEPNLTGIDYFDLILNKVGVINNTKEIRSALLKIKSLVEASSTQFSEENFQNIQNELNKLKVKYDRKKLIQIDVIKEAVNCTLSNLVSSDILLCFKILNIIENKGFSNDPFRIFKDKFISRYESQILPITEVLDIESGIGYAPYFSNISMDSPLIEDLPLFDNNYNNNYYPSNQLIDNFKLDIYEKSIKDDSKPINLTSNEIISQMGDYIQKDRLPNSMYCICQIIQVESNNSRNQIFIKGFTGPSSINLISRFAHLNMDLSNEVKHLMKEEESFSDDCIYAEIVYLQDDRTGNILKRPIQREFEIPFLSNSVLPKNNQIEINDILIFIKNDQIILWSKKHDKRIIPRLSNAHNYHSTKLPIYKFLCDLQYQNIDNCEWTWGGLNSRSFLPRVTIDNCIVSKARWKINKNDLTQYGQAEQSKDQLIKSLINHFHKIKTPEYCFLTQGDNELLLNTNNHFCIEIILEQLYKYNEIILTERLIGDDKIIIDKNGLNYTHEVIFSLTKNKLNNFTKHIKTERKIDHSIELSRHVLPGENWLYFKIYTGYNYAEHILSIILFPIIEKHRLNKNIDKFFFIRYNDPEYHLRIRVYKKNDPDFWEFIQDINDGIRQLVKNNIIYKIQFDTYIREIERYGEKNIENTETLFSYNSLSILKYLTLNKNNNSGNKRWLSAMFVIDSILSDFKLDLGKKREFTENQRADFFKRFNLSSDQKKSISNKFFQERNNIFNYLEDETFQQPLIECFYIDEVEYLATVDSIIANTSKEGNPFLFEWLGSFIHMFINRMFQSNPVQHEMIIYDYLYRYFDSKLAREVNLKK